jgi:hypothetical protein
MKNQDIRWGNQYLTNLRKRAEIRRAQVQQEQVLKGVDGLLERLLPGDERLLGKRGDTIVTLYKGSEMIILDEFSNFNLEENNGVSKGALGLQSELDGSDKDRAISAKALRHLLDGRDESISSREGNVDFLEHTIRNLELLSFILVDVSGKVEIKTTMTFSRLAFSGCLQVLLSHLLSDRGDSHTSQKSSPQPFPRQS